MICKECGTWAPADPETGYDSDDDYCSDACAAAAEEYERELEIWEANQEWQEWEKEHGSNDTR